MSIVIIAGYANAGVIFSDKNRFRLSAIAPRLPSDAFDLRQDCFATLTVPCLSLQHKIKSRENMDGLTFISELIKALAWPTATIILACLLRKPIVGLVPLMRKLKYKELELEFSQEVLALKTEASPVFDMPQKEKLVATTSKALDLVSLSTRAAIMEAWIDVEAAAVEVASSFWNQSPNETMHNLPKLGEYLHQCKVIDDKQLSIYKKLQHLRNKAAHAEELNLSEEDATSYVTMAFNLARHIKSN